MTQTTKTLLIIAAIGAGAYLLTRKRSGVGGLGAGPSIPGVKYVGLDASGACPSGYELDDCNRSCGPYSTKLGCRSCVPAGANAAWYVSTCPGRVRSTTSVPIPNFGVPHVGPYDVSGLTSLRACLSKAIQCWQATPSVRSKRRLSALREVSAIYNWLTRNARQRGNPYQDRLNRAYGVLTERGGPLDSEMMVPGVVDSDWCGAVPMFPKTNTLQCGSTAASACAAQGGTIIDGGRYANDCKCKTANAELDWDWGRQQWAVMV